jgi:hypothetical protein
MNPADYCPDCAELVSALGNRETIVFSMPCDVKFEPGNSNMVRTALWREGDHVEMLHWGTTLPKHMILRNANRCKQKLARLCEKQLRVAIAKLTKTGDGK